ncbi:hypothetical protein TRVA0_007S03906 [Trichomonascus vanleenenianus]|uniref:Zn(II)2Cys6 transcription factor domain-containing protein n=1 Tax=Trichomonascus vanleenenianus TaxID=2268995 RepID=UPI003EC9C6AE
MDGSLQVNDASHQYGVHPDLNVPVPLAIGQSGPITSEDAIGPEMSALGGPATGGSGPGGPPLETSAASAFQDRFRTKRSCMRCRKLKVRCDYASPQSSKCIRCERAKQPECVIVTPYPRGGGGRKPNQNRRKRSSEDLAATFGYDKSGQPQQLSGEFGVSQLPPEQLDWIYNTGQLDSDAKKLTKISQLQKTLQDTAKRLEKLTGRPNGGAIVHSEGQLTRHNCVITAIEQQLMTANEAQYFYSQFLESMASFVPFEVDLKASLDSISVSEPVLALCMITAARMYFNRDSSAGLLGFAEQLIARRMFDSTPCNGELVKSLIVLHTFGYPVPPKSPSFYLFTAVSIANDTVVLSPNLFDNLELYAAVYEATLANGLGIYRHQTALSVPAAKQIESSLRMNPTESNEITTNGVSLLQLAYESISQLLAVDIATVQLEEELTKWKVKLCDVRAAMELTTESNKTKKGHKQMIRQSHTLALMTIAEIALCRLFERKASPPSIGEIEPLGREIVSQAEQLIASFRDNSTGVMCRELAMRPVQALVALARLRLLYWLCGVTVDFDLEDMAKQVKSIWDTTVCKTYFGQAMDESLLQLERILLLRKVSDGDAKMMRSVASLLSESRISVLSQLILFGAITNRPELDSADIPKTLILDDSTTVDPAIKNEQDDDTRQTTRSLRWLFLQA